METVKVPETKSKETAKVPAKSGRKFREVESKFVILSDKDEKNHAPSAEGALIEVGFQTFISPNGEKQTVGRYKLQGDDGSLTTVLGSTTLDDQLGLLLERDEAGNIRASVTGVPMGAYIRLSYAGTSRSGNKREVKQYTVEVAE